MKFRHVNSYAGTPAEVRTMLTTPEFRDEVCSRQRALDHSVRIEEDEGVTSVVITQSQAVDDVPAPVRRLVGSSVQIVQRETWTGINSADLVMEIPGKPGRLKGAIELADNGNGSCDEIFAGDVEVNVPLVGAKLEKFIADILARALRREGQVGADWLGRGTGHLPT